MGKSKKSYKKICSVCGLPKNGNTNAYCDECGEDNVLERVKEDKKRKIRKRRKEHDRNQKY